MRAFWMYYRGHVNKMSIMSKESEMDVTSGTNNVGVHLYAVFDELDRAWATVACFFLRRKSTDVSAVLETLTRILDQFLRPL